MVFSDHTYGVLVVSAAQKFNEALAPLLPGSESYPVCYVPNIAAARRELLSKDYDFVIVNAPLPDDFGTRFAVDACSKSGTVALLLSRADVFDEVEEINPLTIKWDLIRYNRFNNSYKVKPRMTIKSFIFCAYSSVY